MASPLDITEIANLALDYLSEAPITNIDDASSRSARWMKRNFWPVAHELIRRHPWNFAIRRAELAANAVPPAFGFQYGYQLPADCLRCLPLTIDGAENSAPVRHKVEGPDLLTDMEAPIRIRYLWRVNDASLFDASFTEVLALTLAGKAAHAITGKQSFGQALAQATAQALEMAKSLDAMEGDSDDVVDDLWIRARQ